MNKVENIEAKGGFEQFLLLSQYFQKSSAQEASESFYMWERVKKTSEFKILLRADLTYSAI